MESKYFTHNDKKYKFFIRDKYNNRRSSSAFIIINADKYYISLQMISDIFFSFTGSNEDIFEFIFYASTDNNHIIDLFDIKYMIDKECKMLETVDFQLRFTYTPCSHLIPNNGNYTEGLLFLSNPSIKIRTNSILEKL
ncbi:hypothetical protein HOK00_01730 [bacterium]|nr:hypothetical protein [bacterium]